MASLVRGLSLPQSSLLPSVVPDGQSALTTCLGLTCEGPSRRRIAVAGGAGVPKRCMFQFFEHKVVCCGFLVFTVFASSASIFAFVATKQHHRGAIRTNTPCGVRYVACHVQVALWLTFLGPPWCQWCSEWCARLLIASVCRTFLVG